MAASASRWRRARAAVWSALCSGPMPGPSARSGQRCNRVGFSWSFSVVPLEQRPQAPTVPNSATDGLYGAEVSVCKSSAMPASPKANIADDGIQRPPRFEITTCSACCPSGHASSDGHRDSARVPSGHASSVVPTARPANSRGRRWQPRKAGGLVPPGSFRTRPQKSDLQLRSQILCATYVSSLLSMVDAFHRGRPNG